MTSPVVVTKKTYEIDLCPDKPDAKLLNVGDTRVTVTIALGTKKAPAPIVMTRLVDNAAAPTMLRYQKIVQNEVNKLAAKVDMLVKMKDVAGAEDEAKAVSHSVLAACNALQPAVNKAVRELVAADAKSDQNLFEAKIKVAIEVSFKTIAIALDATRVGLTLGADVHADVMLIKHTYDLGVIIYEQMKDEPKLRKEMVKAYDEYLESRKLKKKAETSTVAAVQRGMTQVLNTWTSHAKVAEKARLRYRDEVTSMRQNLEKMSKDAAKVAQLIDDPDLKLKDAAKAKQDSAKLTLKVNALYQNVGKCEKVQANMAITLQEAFEKNKSKTKVDDRTFKERFPDVETSMDLLKDAAEMAKLCKELADIISSAV